MGKRIVTSKLFLSKNETGINSLVINSLKNVYGLVLITAALIIFPSCLYAQTPNFVFDTNDKGILIPRVSLLSATDVMTVPSPGVSLLLCNTATVGVSPNNLTPGFYYWNGAKWQSMSGARSASKSVGQNIFQVHN